MKADDKQKESIVYARKKQINADISFRHFSWRWPVAGAERSERRTDVTRDWLCFSKHLFVLVDDCLIPAKQVLHSQCNYVTMKMHNSNTIPKAEFFLVGESLFVTEDWIHRSILATKRIEHKLNSQLISLE
jgi:hypothetical protein